MSYLGLDEASWKLKEKIRKLVKAMHEDYMKAHESSLVELREKVFREYYSISPIPLIEQSKNIIFVDAGFHSVKTSVLHFFTVCFGSVVRTPGKELKYTGQLGEYDFPEIVFMYGRWGEKDGKPWFTIRIIPLTDSNLLFTSERAERISTRLTNHVNQRLEVVAGEKSLRKLYDLFSDAMEYLEGLLEIAYGLATLKITGDSILVVDGALSRWFTIKSNIKILGFDILDVLSIVLDGLYTSDSIQSELERRVYGLIKRPKLTALARAYSLFRGYGDSQLGLFGYPTRESVEKAVEVINREVKPRYSKSLLKETILLFNRNASPSRDLWITRFPLTTDGDTILFLEAYTRKPVIEYNSKQNKITANGDAAEEVSSRVKVDIGEIMAYRSRIRGLPPYGFMEIDEKVRIDTQIAHMIEDMIVEVIREEIGREGHPLEQLFGLTRKMRLGYQF